MVSTTNARTLMTGNIPDNNIGSIEPSDIREVFTSAFDAIDRLQDAVHVKDYGAKIDGVTDDTAAWNAALATGKTVIFPAGSSVITNSLNYPLIEGVAIIGAGRHMSRFLVSYTNFNMSEIGVLKFNAAYQGAHGFGMRFVQPSTSVRANLKQYPAAINFQSHSRGELSNLIIENSYVGFVLQGNCGGAVIDDIQIWSFFQGMVIDGALDSIRITRFHFWPFGASGDTSLMSIVGDGNVTAIDVGRVDDLVINSMLSFQGRLIFSDHGLGIPSGSVNNLTLDTGNARLEFNAGKFTMSNVNYSTSLSNDFMVTQTGGELRISGFTGEAGANLTPHALVNITGVNARFIGTCFLFTAIGVPNAPVFRVTAGQAVISDGFIQAATGQTQSTPVIEVTGGRAHICHVRCGDKGAGSGTFVKVNADDFHVIMGNSAPGWTYSLPSTQTSGIYGPNK